MAEKDAIIIPVTLMVTESKGTASTNAPNASSASGTPPPKNKQDKVQEEAGRNARSGVVTAVLSHAVGQVASTALQGFGDVTGDYVAGQNLQVAVSETAKIAGAVALGPVGVASYMVDKGVQAFNYVSRLKKSEAQAQFAQKRVYGSTQKS